MNGFDGMLVVKQNRHVHNEVKSLLDQFREIRRQRMASEFAKLGSLEVVSYPLLSPVEQQLARNPVLASAFQVAVTRPRAEGASPAEAELQSEIVDFARSVGQPELSQQFGDRLVDAITKIVEPSTWTSAGGSGEIHSIGGALVVKQTAAVHAKLRRTLAPFSPPTTKQDPSQFLGSGVGAGGAGGGGFGGGGIGGGGLF